jgi:alkanesulfonate monooxygenase SsuD/methylene tetrahydromethanopterin reductase-like flavin-dependent oxidoreductase (luciferase family)
MGALKLYRELFKPSRQLAEPYAMVAANVVVAATDGEARRLFTSVQQSFLNLRRGVPGQLPPPIDNIDSYTLPVERAMLDQTLLCSFTGAPDRVARELQSFIDSTQADELIVTGHIYDHATRLRSFELLSDLREGLTAANEAEEALSRQQDP